MNLLAYCSTDASQSQQCGTTAQGAVLAAVLILIVTCIAAVTIAAIVYTLRNRKNR